MDLKDLENHNIDYLMTKKQIIILDFYTTWCPTCKMLAMTIEEFEEKHPEVFVLEINVDQNKELADLYKIKMAPTLLFIYQGTIFDKYNGFIEVNGLEEIIAKVKEQAIN